MPDSNLTLISEELAKVSQKLRAAVKENTKLKIRVAELEGELEGRRLQKNDDLEDMARANQLTIFRLSAIAAAVQEGDFGMAQECLSKIPEEDRPFFA